MADGGVVALAGFRYQMLRTLEEILLLYQDEPAGDWAVEVEHATDDKVDFAVYKEGLLVQVAQVKASLRGSSTRMSLHGEQGAAAILTALAERFPTTPEVVLISNRPGKWEEIDRWIASSQNVAGPRLRAVREQRTLEEAERSVIDLLRRSRIKMGAPSDPASVQALALILEARLWRLGAHDLDGHPENHRWLTVQEVRDLLDLRDQELASVLGELTWATRWKEPAGRAIPRPAIFSTLAYELDRSALAEGRVRRAVLTGFGGLGKSMAAASWADQNRGLYGMVLWLNSATAETLAADVRQLLMAQQGEVAIDYAVEELQRHFCEWLQTTARTWLLVMDDAPSPQALDGWLPTRGFGHVVITTRDSAWPVTHAPAIEVGQLDADEVRSLVTLRLADDQLSPADLDALARLTDRWALAVDMVLAWMTRTNHKLADLADFDLSASRQRLLDNADLVPSGYPEPVIVIVLDALASLQAEAPAAWELLRSAVALGGQSVPVVMASECGDDTIDALMIRDQQIADLRSRSLASPRSAGDPRLGKWGHRVSVHDLITQVVAQLDPVDEQRWGHLIQELSDAVSEAGDRQDLVVVLSLDPVIEAVDRAVLSGEPFTIAYLTLLGNVAAIYSAAGRNVRAAGRLALERGLARAHGPQLEGAFRVAVEWFGVSATVQLAAVLAKLDRPDDSLLLLEEAVPLIHGCHDTVKPSALSDLMEQAVDVLQTMRLTRHVARRDALFAVANAGPVQAATRPSRLAEAALRRNDLEEARRICEHALGSNPAPLERIDLLGKLAETWAVADVPRSDDLLRFIHLIAETDHIDPEVPLEDLQYVVDRRINHLLELGPRALHGQLGNFGPWFQVLYLMPPPEECRTWQQAAMAHLCRAWHDLTCRPHVVQQSLAAAAHHFEHAPDSGDLAEVTALRAKLWSTQFTHACASVERLEPMGAIARSGSVLLIEVSEHAWNQISLPATLLALAGKPVQCSRFGPNVMVQVGAWGLIHDATQFDPFMRCGERIDLHLARPGTIGEVRDPVDLRLTFPLGSVPNPPPGGHYAEYRLEREELMNRSGVENAE